MGGVTNPASYTYPITEVVVEKLYYETARSNDRNDDIDNALKDAIEQLKVNNVTAITSDCGFMLWYQEQIRQLVNDDKIDVSLSPLRQLTSICSPLDDKKNGPVLVVTVNVKTLEKMEPLITKMVGD